MERGLCLAVLIGLPVLYMIFGQTFFLLCKEELNGGLCLLAGTFVYHALFQVEALPLTLCRSPLKILSFLWLGSIGAVCVLWLLLRRQARASARVPNRQTRKGGRIKPAEESGSRWLFVLMCLVVLVQAYYIVTSNYLGWDTAFYVGTIGSNVATDTIYQYNGDTGWKNAALELRYALSSFYTHASVWCQVLPVRAIDYAKIVQGGVLALLANVTIFQLGRFLFGSWPGGEKFTRRQVENCAAGMVIAAVFINFFYQTIFTTSDFLLNRALEGKGYCANLILPFLFFLGLRMWRDCHEKKTRILLACVMTGNVALSMSALVTAPALFTILMLPVLLHERTLAQLRYYLLCMLPNGLYFILYILEHEKIIRFRL